MMQLFHRGLCGSRRHSIASLAIIAAFSFAALGGCSDTTTPVDNSTAVSGVYVGLAQGTTVPTLVTVDAAAPDASGARKVTIYACDSKEKGTIIWFVGQASGNNFTLSSSNGEATVTVRMSQDSVTGTVNDAAVTFPFSLRRAAAGEGIYTVTVADNGDMQGLSLDGRTRLEGHYPALDSAAVGSMVTTTMILPDSSRQTFTEPSHEATGSGTFRANAILRNGHFGVRGADFPITTTRSQLVGSKRIIGLDMD